MFPNQNQPGPSRHSYYHNYQFFTDYPTRNPINTNTTAAERVRESHRGARQSYNANYQQNAVMNYPHTPWMPTQNQRPPQSSHNQNKDKKREYYAKDKSHRSQYQQSRKNKNMNYHGDPNRKQESTIISNEIDFKLYKCPNCSLQFECSTRYNVYVGRVPLILNCKHTVCQECIPKMAKDNTVLCPVCKNPSVLPPRYSVDNLQDIFFPNFFLIGFIMWCKTQGTNRNFMSLVPVNKNDVNRKSKSPILAATLSQQTGETCCFLSCNKIATLHCKDCSDVYCAECCTTVHKSAKSLWSHNQVPIVVENKKPTLELEKCSEHNMFIEFYCTTCKNNACCYCFLEQHEGHTKENLAKLDDIELKEFQTNKENARKLLKQLLISQRRIKDLYSGSTINIEKKISNYFMNLHAKLQFIEKNLKKDISKYSSDGVSAEEVDNINSNLTSSVENLTSIVIACDSVEVKKMNLREIAKRLKEVQNLPCYLLSDDGKGLEPLEFEVEPLVDSLEDFFAINKNEKCDFKLVSEEDLPSNYEKDSTELQYESDVESCISSLSKFTVEDKTKKKVTMPKTTIGNQVPLENEMVEVTHIESLECFYVQLKKTQCQFSQMNRDITDYIKMGAPTVDHPQLNELYLVMYQTRNEKIWCRGRVTELKNGEMEPLYEVFFIDYGSNQTVDISKLRQITADLAHKKPFAIHCELYNPSNANWGKNAHVYMGKMINGKQISMFVKRVHSGVHEVDLMVMSSDRVQTSIIDILIHTCSNALSTSSDNESVSSQKLAFNRGFRIFGNSIEFRKFQQERVILVNVIDPHHIFVHLVSYAESLKKLNHQLKQTYKNSRKNTFIPLEGTYIIVDYKDPIRGNWHRGLVKKVDVTDEKCHVLLVDWGLNVTVSWSNIRTIKEEFTRLESQAIMVKLAHIEPLDKGTVWLDTATIFLQKYYRAEEVMKIVVHNVDPLEVALFEIVGDVDICINTQLVLENFAESTGKISETLEWPRNDAEVKGFAEDDLVSSLLRKVESTICESDEEEDKNIVRQKIEVIKFVSPDLIYIKFSKFSKQELNLHKELQIHYIKEHKTKKSWEVGELCVVYYNLSYARGKILEKISEKKYKVNVYDRAVEAELPLNKIFVFAKYFNNFPNVVFKSHLANIRPAGGDTWSMSSTEALEQIFNKFKDIYGTRVQGDITGKSIPMHMWYTRVTMGGALEASKTKFISLNDALIKLGYAYKVTSGSIKSGKSSGSSKSVKSTKSTDSTYLLSAIEKAAEKPSSDVGTDLDSTISDLRDDDLPTSDIQGDDSSLCDAKDDVTPIPSIRNNKIESKDTFDFKRKIDWNQLIEEEQNAFKNDDDSQDDAVSCTQETEIDDWIPAFAIKETEFNAWITCAETEGILYLREEKLQNVYKEMEANIKEYFDKKPPAPSNHKWKPGELCIIHYNDLYYRGKVYKVNSPDDIVVVMIDFGSDHTLTSKDLNREILYPKIPAFASKIKLDRVYPKSGAWLDSDYQTLLEIVTEYSKIVIKRSLDVEIPTAEVYTDDGKNINHILVQKCLNLTRTQPKQSKSDDDDDDVIIEEEAIIGDDDETIVEIHKTMDDCDYEQDELITKGSDIDTTKHEYKILPFPNKETADKVEVSITSVLEYNRIGLREISSVTVEFEKLSKQIQAFVKYQPTIQTLEHGMPCVCPFSEDGAWYRAQINNAEDLDCGYVFVYFVDFGNIESVAISDVKMMRPEWFECPVSCRVANINIKLNSDKNIKHVIQHMRKLCSNNKHAKIITKEPLCVDLYESNGTLAYQSLLDKGLIQLK